MSGYKRSVTPLRWSAGAVVYEGAEVPMHVPQVPLSDADQKTLESYMAERYLPEEES